MHSFYIIIIDNVNPSTLYVGLQTKRKFPCPVFGPKIKSRHSKSLRNDVFDEYMHFLSNNHRYQTTNKPILNGKQEIALKPQRMTPHIWKLQYNRNHQGTYISNCLSIIIYEMFWIFFNCVLFNYNWLWFL